MHIPGLLGMPRRIYTYEPGRWVGHLESDRDDWSVLSAAGILIFFGNLLWSYFRGKTAGSDPWDAWTLEWSTSFTSARMELFG